MKIELIMAIIMVVLKWSFIPLVIGSVLGFLAEMQADELGDIKPKWQKVFYFLFKLWFVLLICVLLAKFIHF